MKYLRNTHHISVKCSQTQALRNMGYYHGFKGYRFIREDTNRVNFTSLDEVIARNNVIFDTRFKTGAIDQRLINLLESEVGISNINFKYMDAYVIMITYFLRKMGETKTSCKQFVASYQQQTEYLRNELPINIYNQVVGTQHRPNMNALRNFISRS